MFFGTSLNLRLVCLTVNDGSKQVGENVRFGGTGVVEQSDVEKLVGLARHPNVYVKISAFYALGMGEAPYHDLIPLIGQLLDACAEQSAIRLRAPFHAYARRLLGH